MDTLLTHRDIAERLQIGVGKARNLMRSGGMTVVEVADYGNGKKSRRVTEEEFGRWVRERMTANTQKQPKRRIVTRFTRGSTIPKTIDEIFE